MIEKMAVLCISLFLLLLQGCWFSVEGVKVYKEDKLYESSLWREQSSVLIITRARDSSIPDHYLTSLEQQLKRSSIPTTHIKVTCEDGAGLVCGVLSSHQLALRRGEDRVEGMAAVKESYSSDAEFVSTVLEFLLGEGMSMLSSYSDLKDYAKQHPHHLLALTDNTTSSEFIDLLVSVLSYHTPLAVLTNVGCLPLNQRPRYYSHMTSTSTIHLWSVSEGQWIKLPQEDTLDQQRVKDFLNRLQYPIIVTNYKDNQREKLPFSEAQLHPVFVFPALSGASDIDLEQLVTKLAQKHFMNYIFIMADRSIHGALAQRLFINDDKYYPHLIVLPYGDETRLISIEIEGQDTLEESDRVAGVLDSVANDHIWSEDNESPKAPSSPSITDPSSLLLMTSNNAEYSILAVFCKIGEDSCIDRNFPKLQSAMRAVGGANVGISVGGMIVECLNVKDLLRFQLNSLPSYALFNHTEKKWYGESGEVSTPNDLVSLVAKATGISGLVDIASFSNLVDAPNRQPPPPVHPLLQEDDHFGLLVHTLPKIVIPHELTLTNTNLESVVLNFTKTAVVFYMRWDVRSKVFLHHVMAAWEKLDKSLNVSLGTINCEDYTDVCSRYGIVSFPMVLLFTPSTLHTPAPLTQSTLTSQQLLRSLGQDKHGTNQDEHNQDRQSLVELTPATLPSVLRGTLTTPLIVWCDSHVTPDTSKVFSDLTDYEEFAFAWMNSSRYGELLKRVTSINDITFPTVIALKLNMRAVYHLAATAAGLSGDLKDDLTLFLSQIKDGSAQPTCELPSRSWLPLKPPLPFPSSDNAPHSQRDVREDHQDSYLNDNYFEDEFLFDAPPMDTPPPSNLNRRPGNPIHRRQRQQPGLQAHADPPYDHRHNEL